MSHEIHVTLPGGTEILPFRDTVRLGRAETNEIVIADDYVSGEHLELRRTGDEWEIVDLDSTNGTFIDGERVTRVRLGHRTRVRLGRPGGLELLVTIPALGVGPGSTLVMPAGELVSRYLGDEEPEDMSERTRVLRASLRQHRQQEARVWLKRTRQMRIVTGMLVLVAGGAGGVAWWQGRRVRAQRRAAAALFHTMKALELDVRRLEAEAGPDPSIRERRDRLEAQYEDLLTTLGIYSDRTPPEVRLIYRTVHRLGESEATVPREFVDEVRHYIDDWKETDLRVSLDRAEAADQPRTVAAILREHNLPREFFYLALQESKLDPRAVGPSTAFGVPKGMWQLIPRTAEAYGLRLGPLEGERVYDPLDERHDVARATAAAARYLSDIYETDAQASGLLVMAAYNLGEPRLLRLIRSMPESPADRNFWALLEKYGDRVPKETRDYVYRIVSAAVIGSDPGLFGYDFEPPFGDAQVEEQSDSERGAPAVR